ncbi:quinoid dihydropteridine reductase [Dimargaris cristalligena]|uniref:Dihydropteridine reductase n=1 Tax=Dimargaris cristalligena TaxID=215637 RepID=A0A4P9ZUE4_9FUNG|nr:quinoid dihydropteridine reductase [Dimargaris cristalligena]|eukprot:RKP36491.1 quinoid dihydropteridine reductase [Dimargaris cristalligena]
MASQVIVYGGSGALGTALVKFFKAQSWCVISVDLRSNPEADHSVNLDSALSLEAQAHQVLGGLQPRLDKPVEAVLCVAGGWAGGSVTSSSVFATTDLMWKQSVQSSLIAARIASQHLRAGGLLTLTGAQAAQGGTPGMLGYGMAKAAVHQLTASLADPASGLPQGAWVNAILPVTLDTPANRAGMPDADFSSWTPLSSIAKELFEWASGRHRLPSGSLVKINTQGGETTFSV